MILFINVFITDQRLSPEKYPILANQKAAHLKFDVFKYTLASYSVVPWEGAIFYIKLDTQYEKYRDKLKIFIHKLFPKNIKLYNFRLDSYEQWLKAIQLPEYPSETWIWFTCNDDHIFIDSNLTMLNRLIEAASKLSIEQKKFVSVFPSHWQEMMAAKKRSICLNNKLYRAWSESNVKILEDNQDYYLTTSKNCCPIQIITKKLLWLWFADPNRFHKNNDFRKTDGFIAPEEQITLIPYRELFRHFDAYSHSFLSHDIVPPMFIPKGFFKKQMKIQYGGNERLPGYVYIHPEKKMISQQMSYADRKSSNLCDINISFDDIPLFWKDRIAHVATNDIASDIIYKSYIIQKIKEVCADPRFGYTPFEAIHKVTAAFCQKYQPDLKELKTIIKKAFRMKEKAVYRWRIARYSYLLNPLTTFNCYWMYYLFTFIRLQYPGLWAKGKKLKETIDLWKKRLI